jgi:hypothetical protein
MSKKKFFSKETWGIDFEAAKSALEKIVYRELNEALQEYFIKNANIYLDEDDKGRLVLVCSMGADLDARITFPLLQVLCYGLSFIEEGGKNDAMIQGWINQMRPPPLKKMKPEVYGPPAPPEGARWVGVHWELRN